MLVPSKLRLGCFKPAEPLEGEMRKGAEPFSGLKRLMEMLTSDLESQGAM